MDIEKLYREMLQIKHGQSHKIVTVILHRKGKSKVSEKIEIQGYLL